MRRFLKNLLSSLRQHREFIRLLRKAEEDGAVNPDLEPAPILIRGGTVYQIPIAFQIGGRTGRSTVRMAVHPSTPKSALIAAALRKVSSDLPAGAKLRLVAQPMIIEQ
jgi:hypothetical protein